MKTLRLGLQRLRDPRYYQIAVLGCLLMYGILILDFGIRAENAAAIFSFALATQFLAGRIVGLPHFDPLSPLISSLSLTLLLRTDTIWLAAAAAILAIGSKFLLRVQGKHVFNPANFAIVALIILSEHAWVSSGQWGSAAIGALTLGSLGLIVITRAKRAETTLCFIGAYALLLIGRDIWLGDPMSIPLHQMQNGALLIFSFFMISDPRTSPNTPLGRGVFALLVASIAFVIQFVFYQPNGPILALVMTAPLVPIIDKLSSGIQYDWKKPKNTAIDARSRAIKGAQ